MRSAHASPCRLTGHTAYKKQRAQCMADAAASVAQAGRQMKHWHKRWDTRSPASSGGTGGGTGFLTGGGSALVRQKQWKMRCNGTEGPFAHHWQPPPPPSSSPSSPYACASCGACQLLHTGTLHQVLTHKQNYITHKSPHSTGPLGLLLRLWRFRLRLHLRLVLRIPLL